MFSLATSSGASVSDRRPRSTRKPARRLSLQPLPAHSAPSLREKGREEFPMATSSGTTTAQWKRSRSALSLSAGVTLEGERSEIFAGSELEAYLRDLQLVGMVSLYPWSIRSFSPRELDALFPADSAVHPWTHRYELRPPTPAPNTLSFDVVRPTVSARVNTTFPYGSNDGPIWAGRGVTPPVQLGFAVRYRFVSLTVAPLAFVAQNASFALMPDGPTGRFVHATRVDPV